jgi:hypothetical protein
MAEADRNPTNIAILACAKLAVMLVLALAWLGVPRATAYGGHDSSFSIRALYFLGSGGFWHGLTTGWIPDMQMGFGAPVFQFYPPLAFALGAGVQLVLATDAVTALAITVALARLAGGLFCFLWLQRPAGSRAALLGASAYVLLPFTGLFDPVIRFAYAETIATALLPLLPLALDATRLSAGQRIAAFGAGLAAVLLTNVPVAVAAALCCAAYAAAMGFRRLAEAAAGGALALTLAAWHLVPALAGIGAISAGLMMDEGHSWSGTMLFWGSMALHQVDLIWDFLYLTFLLFLGVAVLGFLSASGTRARASLVALLVALAFCTPLTLPAWRWGRVLDFVQFPWRFLLLASLFGCGVIALARQERLRFWLALVVFALGLATPAGILTIDILKRERGVVFEPAAERLAEAIDAPHADAQEYLPAQARRDGWSERLSGHAAARDLPRVVAGSAVIEAFGWESGNLRIAGHADTAAAILLPQFGYPGWRITGTDGVRMDADSESGLLELLLPPGPFSVTLSRASLPFAREGGLASVGALAAALVLCLVGRPRVVRSREAVKIAE